MGENSVISGAAMSDFIARKEGLNAKRNVLRKDLLEDIKNNPSEVWEWRGFIEQSENETAQLLDLDNKVSQILYDQAMRNISEREALTEQQLAQAEKNAELMKEQLRQKEIIEEKEKQFKEQLLEQNEKITEQKLQLVKEATEREEMVEKLDRGSQMLVEVLNERFNEGKEVVEQYLEDKISGGSNVFQRAVRATNLESTWDNYGKAPTKEKKRQLKLGLARSIEEQELLVKDKVRGFMGALPRESSIPRPPPPPTQIPPPRSPSLTRTASGSSVGSGAGLSPRRTVSGENLINVLRATSMYMDQPTTQPQLTPPTPGQNDKTDSDEKIFYINIQYV